MKLSLSLPALERLLAGDTQLETELRHQVAQNFVKNHLMELTKTEAFKKSMDIIRAEVANYIKQEIGEMVKVGSGWQYTITGQVRDKVRELINTTASKTIDEIMTKLIDEKVQKYTDCWAKVINARVEAQFKKNIDELVKQEIQRRLEAAAKG